MKTKTLAVIISVILIVSGVIYSNFDSPTEVIQKSPVVMKSSKGRSIREVKNLDSPKPKKITGKVSTEDIKVIAATSNEAEKLASKFYNEILSIVGLKDGFINHVEAGQSINVNNFYDVEEPASQFIPLYSNNKVVGVSIFREYDVGEKKLGRMSEIKEDWYSYPPVMAYNAEFAINTNYPTINYTHVPGYYFIEDGETPYYLYEENEGDSSKYYLVSAYDKNIIVKNDREEPKLPEEKLPVKLSKNGFMKLDSSALSSLNDKELEQLRSDIELTNKYIKEGLLKFDENMNVIYDKRNTNVEISDIFLSEESIYPTDNYPFDNEKMNDSGEAATVIR
ncbi:hypothetical protein [uncultured Gammaproteobacteria bacterium]|nr:hypothetical protein [uncultured Gammaproteobacteria bacterium]